MFVTIPTSVSVRQRELMELYAIESELEKNRKDNKQAEREDKGRKIIIDEDEYWLKNYYFKNEKLNYFLNNFSVFIKYFVIYFLFFSILFQVLFQLSFIILKLTS